MTVCRDGDSRLLSSLSGGHMGAREAGATDQERAGTPGGVMSMHASILVDSVGPPSAEVYRTAASFP
jgi:hypothetical protein